MNSIETIEARCTKISEGVAERYRRRTAEREPRLVRAREMGALAAASRPEAVGRASHLTAIEGRNLEATSGNYDIDQVNFLARGMKAARPVCRVVHAGTSWGTGFLVAPGLLITNHHVLPDPESAAACDAEFNYEYDAEDQPRPRFHLRLRPDRIFVTSPETALDFSIVAVEDPEGRGQSMGWLPLDPRENKIVAGEPAVSIEHPGQEDKKICLFDSVLVDKIPDPAQPFLHYTTDTEKGASGSPIFNRNWQVIALHHGSFTLREPDPAGGTHRLVVVNEGIRVSRLMAALTTGNDITAGTEAMRLDVRDRLTSPAVVGNSRPQGPPLSNGTAGPGHTDTAASGGPAAGEVRPRADLEAARTVVRTPPRSHYAGRKGFNENFLGSGELRVPLPVLAAAMLDDVAPLLHSRSSYVLKYQHYSVVMCASRRLAYYSACNLDGSSNPASFDRKRRLPIVFESARSELELEQAADRWYFDPRMALDYQPQPGLFDDSATRFDFGHITRRMDVVWGDDAARLLGSDDSFHMTNCSPQVSSYNQHGDWGSLEDAIAKFARGAGPAASPRKVSVISGPVLHPSDLTLLGVQVPGSFWKVLAFEEDGELRSLAFLTSQRELVDAERKKLESTKSLVTSAFANEWLTTVRDISRLTSLDFGPLLAADLFAAQGRRNQPITADLLDQLFV